jgi:hypothetical protein
MREYRSFYNILLSEININASEIWTLATCPTHLTLVDLIILRRALDKRPVLTVAYFPPASMFAATSKERKLIG